MTTPRSENELSLAPADASGIDQATRIFLRLAMAAVAIASLASVLVNLVFVQAPTHRLAYSLAPLVAVGLSWWLLRRGQLRAGMVTLAIGTWVAATWIIAVSGGVRSSVVISYPLIILVSGWLLGARAAIWLALLTVSVMLAFAVMAMNDALPVKFPSHTMMYWLVQLVICGLCATLITYLLRSQRQQIATVRELTSDLVQQRTLAESADALRRSQELLDRTGHLARVGGWSIDVDAGTLSWTAETYRIHGRDREQPVSLADFLACYAPAERARLDAALRSAERDGEPFDLELPLAGGFGRSVWVRIKGEAQYAAGRATRVIGAVQDVTEQRLAARELRDSLKNLRATLEVTEDGIFGYNGRDPSGRLLFANDRFFDIWGIPREQAASTGRAEVIAAARRLFIDPDSGVQRINEILAMGEPHVDKVPLNDGRVIFRRSIPIAEDTEVTRVWSFRDITAEERLKAELEASRDEAHRASKAKSTFLANMSHELRTPMNAIIGMTALSLRRTDDPRLSDYLRKIDQASAHLLGVINDILDISKIEADRMTLEQTDFRLGDALDGLVALIGGRAREKGLSFEVGQTPELRNLQVRGDPLRLNQILLNLGGNAVKFTERGGVTIRVRLLERVADGVLLRFEVCDTGIGISVADQARLFALFEQADNSMTRKYGGTGLGLAISKRLVALMGGEIGVDSAPGRGSTFWFAVRLRLGSGAAASTAPRPSGADVELRQRFAGTRVLLAEDEPINREVALDLLEDVALIVDLAEDGMQALDLARRNRYAAILMDIQMPRLNGIEATREIRADSLNRDTPILAMTANAFVEDRAACLAAGMNDHLGKPVNPDLLYRRLLAWLDVPAESPDR